MSSSNQPTLARADDIDRACVDREGKDHGLAAEFRRCPTDTGVVESLFALAPGPEKTAAMRVYFELYCTNRIANPAFAKPQIVRALAWLREVDDASFASLLPSWLVSGLPDAGLLLVRFDAELARRELGLHVGSALPGLVALGLDEARHRADELFSAYERAAIVKGKEAASIALST